MSTPETRTVAANAEIGRATDAYEQACVTLAAEYAALETTRLTAESAQDAHQQQGTRVELAKTAEKDARRQLQRALAGVDLVE